MNAGGPVIPIQLTFLSRSSGSIQENSKIPIPSNLSFSTDVRQFSGAFDFSIALGPNEVFDVQSHDFVEFWFMANGIRHQIGVGFLEDFEQDASPESKIITANGREFSGQLINIPFRKTPILSGVAYETFLRQAVAQGYFNQYASYRNLSDSLSRVNSYAGGMTVVGSQTMMVGALIQQYADLALNVAYQNRLGQLEVYGRGTQDATLNVEAPV